MNILKILWKCSMKMSWGKVIFMICLCVIYVRKYFVCYMVWRYMWDVYMWVVVYMVVLCVGSYLVIMLVLFNIRRCIILWRYLSVRFVVSILSVFWFCLCICWFM